MGLVGSIGEIDLFSPNYGYLSFFNSPYIGHALGTAVDIYPGHDYWNGPVESPVTGHVTNIQKMTMGRKKEFPTEEFDYAIGISPIADNEKVVRILHCKPNVAIGDKIHDGDNIGTTIRSRFFNYWTGPHYHVEVMNMSDFHRSSKSLPIETKLGRVRATRYLRPKIQNEYHLEVVQATKDSVTVGCGAFDIARSPYYSGLATYTEEGVCGILDAGVSHYVHGGLICIEDLAEGTKISFHGTEIGEVDISNPDLHHFKRTNILEYFFNGEQIRGLSSFLHPTGVYSKSNIPMVIVPMRYAQFEKLEEGDVCELRISNPNNMVKAK